MRSCIQAVIQLKKKISVKRPSYDKIGLTFFLDQSTKKYVERKEPNPRSLQDIKYLNMIESTNTPKEKENVIHFEKSKESDQDETPSETRKESHVRCFTCDEPRHIEDDYKGKSFKPISKFYCHNCHGYGHNAVDYEKPRFENDNANSRMFRKTNPIGNRRKRSHNNESGERRQIFCYRCNNLGHIVRNCRAPNNQYNEP